LQELQVIYAGIGSRETPEAALAFMTRCAREWAQKGWTLRSGGAKGADSAFEKGAIDGGGDSGIEIFYTDRYRIGYSENHDEDRFAKLGQSNVDTYAPELWLKAKEIAAEYHPAWNRCSPYARKLHARNSFIILGERLDDPVGLVVCWTEGGALKGGTAQGLRIAKDYQIPIANLGHSTYGFND
jgi:hypothetical protein